MMWQIRKESSNKIMECVMFFPYFWFTACKSLSSLFQRKNLLLSNSLHIYECSPWPRIAWHRIVLAMRRDKHTRVRSLIFTREYVLPLTKCILCFNKKIANSQWIPAPVVFIPSGFKNSSRIAPGFLWRCGFFPGVAKKRHSDVGV